MARTLNLLRISRIRRTSCHHLQQSRSQISNGVRYIDGAALAEVIDHAYAETVHWRRNLFKVPSGKVGKAFFQKWVTYSVPMPRILRWNKLPLSV